MVIIFSLIIDFNYKEAVAYKMFYGNLICIFLISLKN